MSKKNEPTNQDLLNLVEGIRACAGLKGRSFAMILMKNHKVIEDTLDKIREQTSPDPKFYEYKAKRNSLQESTSEDRDKLISKLDEESKELLAEHEVKVELQKKLLQEKAKVKLVKISNENFLPEDISVEQMAGISLLLDI